MVNQEIWFIILLVIVLLLVYLYCIRVVREIYRAAAERPLEPGSGHWAERYLEVVPGVFLIVGLFGTFLGLANAISAAGDALKQSSATVEALTQQFQGLKNAIEGIGVKFISSLAGIAAHLLARLSYGIFVLPLQRVLELRREQARAAERQEAETRGRDESRRVAVMLAEIRDSLAGLASIPNAMGDSVKALDEATNASRKAVATTLTAVEQSSQLIGKADGTTQAIVEAVRNLRSSNEATARANEGLVRGVEQSVTGLRIDLESKVKGLSNQVDRVRDDINAVASGALLTLGSTTEKMNGALQQYDQKLRAILATNEKIEASIKGVAQQTGARLELLTKEFAGPVEGQLENLRKATQVISESMDRHSQALRDLQVVNQQFAEMIGTASKSTSEGLQNTASSLRAAFTRTVEQQVGSLNMSTEALRQAMEAHTRALQAVPSAGRESAAVLEQAASRLETELASLSRRRAGGTP